jgi:hypothetical protein
VYDVRIRLLVHPEARTGAVRWFLTATAWIGASGFEIGETSGERFAVGVPMHGLHRDSVRLRAGPVK